MQSEAPPLISYFFVIPQLAGGSVAAYQTYFAAFAVLTALVLYYGLRRWDDLKAFKIGIVYLLSPFVVIESVFGVQDEVIMVFLFLLAVLLAMRGNGRWSALTVAIGIWTKFFSALFYPILLLKTKGWRERLIHLGIIVAFSIAISIPFLIVAPNQFLAFPTYYFLGGGVGACLRHQCLGFPQIGRVGLPGHRSARSSAGRIDRRIMVGKEAGYGYLAWHLADHGHLPDLLLPHRRRLLYVASGAIAGMGRGRSQDDA